jgi:hypothetical protein
MELGLILIARFVRSHGFVSNKSMSVGAKKPI